MKKFRLYYDTNKEMAWLNSMAQQGWACTNFCLGVYSFEPCEKGEYLFQADTAERFGYISPAYREFMEETGSEIVTVWGPWVLLRRKAELGKFELYTDVDSRIKHFEKQRNIFKVALILELICMWMELFAALTGTKIAYVFLFIIAAFVLAFCHQVYRISEILSELYEQKGETGNCLMMQNTRKKAYILLVIGLVCSCISTLLRDVQADFWRGFSEGMGGAACGLMLVGCFMILWYNRGKQD